MVRHVEHISELINHDEDLFQSDKDRIKFYREWIAIQIINVNNALKRAQGTGDRNNHGFRDRGCGCNTCKARYRKELEHLDEIKMKLNWERRRQKGKHQDQEEQWIADMAQARLDQIRAERGDD